MREDADTSHLCDLPLDYASKGYVDKGYVDKGYVDSVLAIPVYIHIKRMNAKQLLVTSDR